MASNCETFFKITKNKTIVFVSSTMITDKQIEQLNCQDAIVRVDVPKLKIINLSPHLISNREKTTDSSNTRVVLNYITHINGANNCLNSDIHNNRPKRKLKSNSVKNESHSDDKKPKCDYKETDGKRINVKMSSNQKKNKENRNNCGFELSRVIGLPNMGNTCYINSIIQVLRMTPGFRQFVCSLNKTIVSNKNGVKLKTSNRKMISSLHNIFVHFGDNEVNGDKLNTIPNNESKITDLIECDDIKNRFEFGQQQDCHEFLNWLINELNTFAEVLVPNKRETNSLAKNIYNTRRKNFDQKSMCFQSFQGVMLRNIMCSECKRDSSTHDSFADIQIPLCVNEEVTDNDSEKQSFADIIHRKDYLKDDNKFDCHNCSKKTNASVVNSIEIPPKVLIIFIKKPFEYNQTNTRNVKPLKKLFTVPLELEYSSKNSNNSVKYSLYGFVMHSGSDIDNGHYYAVIDSGRPNHKKYIKKSDCSCAHNVLADNGWIKVNDHKVSKLDNTHLSKLLDNDTISSTPYLAFYQRID